MGIVQRVDQNESVLSATAVLVAVKSKDADLSKLLVFSQVPKILTLADGKALL